MARPKLDHDERRAKIAAAACDVILEVGLENTKLVDVASKAGVTTGAVQHYFRNKEELLFFAKNHVFDQRLQKSKSAIENLEGEDRLLDIVRRHVPNKPEHIKAMRLLEAFRGRAIGDPTLLRNQHKRDMAFLDTLTREIEGLKELGKTKPDLDVRQAALGLNALLDGLGCLVMPSPKSFKEIDLVAIAENFIYSVIGVPPPTSRD